MKTTLLITILPMLLSAQSDSLLQHALRLNAQGRYAEGVSALLLAGADTGSAFSRAQLGLAYANLNDYPNARKYLSGAVKLDSANVDILFQYARFLHMSFVLPEARLAYLDLLNRDSLHGSAWFQLAQVARVVGDPEDLVRTYYRKSIRINPRDYLSYFYLGSSLADSSETRHEGEFFLRKSLDINPFFLPAIERLGSYYSALKLDSLAALFYAEAADLRPKNPDFWFYLGESVRKLKLSDSAVVCFGRAIELDSTNAAYVGQFGYAYVQMKAYALAVAAYEHAILLEPDNPQFYSNLAIAYQRMDSVDAAVAAYEKALTYEPNSTESMFFLALALDQRK